MATAKECPAGESLLAYVQEHVDALAEHGARAAKNKHDAVHQLRISVRRLGTTLATYRKLLSAEESGQLAAELKWLTKATGPVRDAEVMRRHLGRMLAKQEPELVIGPIAERIDERLGAEFEAARVEAKKALTGERFDLLLEAFGRFLKDPPLTSMAEVPAEKILPILIERECTRLDHAVATVVKSSRGPHRDNALHEARKRARRLRYSSEIAAPFDRARTHELMEAAQDLQKTLGLQHDSVVARALLLSMRQEAEQRGESEFTYGRLHALAQARSAEAEVQFFRSWKDFPTV